jgi:fibronectin type 3 domain-containing protein
MQVALSGSIRRVWGGPVLALTVVVIGLFLGGGKAAAATPSCQSSAPTGGTYTVTVCLTTPADGSTVSGDTTVTATLDQTSGGPGARRAVFYLDGSYLLTDYQSPYSFTIPTAKFVDGAHTLSVETLMRDGFTSQQASIGLTFNNGVTTPPVNTNHFTPTPGTDPAPGNPFTVAAVGDGAGGESSETDVTNLISGWNPNLALYLGDVYEEGAPTEFYNYYRPQAQAGSFFGKFRSITDPVIGNHEYTQFHDGTAPGYFDYWDNIPHYYSYETHGWHLISLDSTNFFNQTTPTSPQYQWLANDLDSLNWGTPVNVGTTSVGASTTTLAANTKYADKVTLSTTSKISKISAYLDGVSKVAGGSQVVRAAVYADASGSPGALKATSAEVTVAKNVAGAWVDFTFNPAVTLPAGNYWIALHAGATSGIVRLYGGTASGAGRTAVDTYSDGPSDPFGTATSVNSAWSMYASATPARTPPCTLAYWHEPLFNIGPEGSASRMSAIWSLLAQYKVPLVLNGHDHDYQRWVPLDGNGNPDPSGITEIIDGAGGHSLQSQVTTDNRVVASYFDNFGALRMQLNPAGAGYQFITRTGQLIDSGSVKCDKSTADTTAPTDPTSLVATATYKTWIKLNWNTSTDNVGVTGYEIYRDGSLLTKIGPLTTYTDDTVAPGSTHSYQVRAVDAAGNYSNFTDTASATTPKTGVLFSDGFESGDLSNWANPAPSAAAPNNGLTTQQSNVFAGAWAAESQSDGTAGAAAAHTVNPTETNLYYETRFKVLSQASNINLLRFRDNTIAQNAIATVFVTTGNKIGIRDDVSGVSTTSALAAGLAAPGVWHTVEAHVVVNGTSSQTEVWLDGTPVPDLNQSGIDLGTNPIARLDLGGTDTGRTFDVAFDQVAYDREFIGDTAPPTTPTGLTATANYRTEIDLSWNASSDDVGVSGYDVYRDGSLLTTVGPQTTYFDGSVSAGSTHTYQVVARDAAGNVSDFSNSASATTPTGGVRFFDGFETGDLSKWTNPAPSTNPPDKGLVVQQSNVFAGSWGAEATSDGAAGAAATRTINPTATELYYEARFKVLSQSSSVNLLRFRDNSVSQSSIATVFVSSTNKIGVRNDVTGVSTTSTSAAGTAARGAWHTVQAHLVVNGSSSQTDVWVDGVAVSDLSLSGIDLGTSPIGRLDLGDLNSTTSPKTFDVAFDDVAYDGQFITDTAAPTAPTNLVATSPSGYEVDLSWTPSTDDVGVTGYDVYRNDQLIASIGPGSSYADKSVSPIMPYTYKVQAKDAAGNLSPFSNTALATTGDVFADNFEAGNLSKWSSVSGLTVQQQVVDSGQWAARATSTGTAGSSAQATLPAASNELYYRARFDIQSQGTSSVSLLRFRTAANASIASVFVSGTGKIGYRNDVNSTTVTSGQSVSKLVWHELQLHVLENGASSQADVWLDGTKVISQTIDLGTVGPIGKIELGDPSLSRTFDIAFDNVIVDPASVVGGGGPSAPPNLHTTQVTGTEADLAWDASSSNVAITGYRVYRDGALIAALGPSALTYADTSVSDASQYTYGVTAVDSTGAESGPSSVQVTTPDATPPAKPIGLTAAAAQGKNEVDLSWNATTDNVGVTGYSIYRNGTKIDSVDGSTLTYADTSVHDVTVYSYAVTAVDAAANESPQSDPATVTTNDLTAPSAPSNLQTTSVSDSQVSLGWDASTDNVGVSGYRIYRDGTQIGSVDGSTQTYTDTSATGTSTYTYAVTALDAAGNESSSISIQVATPPAKPTGLTATAVSGQKEVDLSWTASPSNAVSGYQIYRGGTKIGSVGGSTLTYADTTVTGPRQYTYTVTAVDAAGHESQPSDSATVTTGDLVAPTPPPTLTATAVSSSEIDLNWSGATDNVGVTGYKIFRDGSLVASVGASPTSYDNTGLNASQTYTYAVKAVDAAGNVSNASSSASATTVVFSDGFETGNLSRWTSTNGLIVQGTNVYAGSWAAEAKSSKNTAAFAVKQLPSTYQSFYYTFRFKMLSGKPDTVDMGSLQTASGSSLLTLYYDSNGKLGYRNDTTRTLTTSSTTLATGTWYQLKVHVVVQGSTSQVEVWLNGTKVAALSKTDSLGTTPVGQIVAGEPLAGHAYDYAIDDVVADPNP